MSCTIILPVVHFLSDPLNSNPLPNYAFVIDIHVLRNNSATPESYAIAGVIQTSTQSNVPLPPTNANGITTFDIIFMSQIDSGDGVSVQVKSAFYHRFLRAALVNTR